MPLEEFARMPYDKDIFGAPHREEAAGRVLVPSRAQAAHRHPFTELRCGPGGGVSGASSWVRVPRVPWCFAMSRGSSPAGITEESAAAFADYAAGAVTVSGSMWGQRRIPTRTRARAHASRASGPEKRVQ